MAAPAEQPAASSDDAVVVLAPVGRDAFIVCQTLAAGSITCITSQTMTELIEVVRGGVGAVVVTEEALTQDGVTSLLAVLGEHPTWSDLPIVLLYVSTDGEPRATPRHVTDLAMSRTVTVLERPIPAVTLVSAVQAALAARRRQYEVRDLLSRERIAREEAEAATLIKDEFLATVSHELRSPLSAILLWARLLEDGRVSGDNARTAMHAITSSAEAQSRLIEDLLDVSRMLTGKLRIDVRSVSLGPLVTAAVDVVRPMAMTKDVALEAQLPVGDDVILADPDRVQQIVWNLLSNAVKFTPSGGVVSLRLSPDHDDVVLTVTDTGQGIAPELLPHVFERFRQGDAGSAQRQGGLGLGLSIVRQLVELHGGTIEAHSDGLGQGATFRVRLPRGGRRRAEPPR